MTERFHWAEHFDGFNIAVIIKIPIIGWGPATFLEEQEGCPKCDNWNWARAKCYEYIDEKQIRVPCDKFCQSCGSPRSIEMKEVKERGNVPIPDIRQELTKLNLSYASFPCDQDSEHWIVYGKILKSLGYRSDWSGDILAEFKNTDKEIAKVKEKHKSFIRKYKGKVSFAVVSDYFDW